MPTQDSAGIPFGFHHSQQSFRLLELPPALLEVVTSKPSQSLFLKSAASDPSISNQSHAVLCTDDQTFQLRQVHSSNSIFVLQPSESNLASAETDGIRIPSVSAIAQCAATLELIPVCPSAVIYLKQALNLQIYRDPRCEIEDQNVLGSHSRQAVKKSKTLISEDAPMSQGEFDKGWTELCAFESEDQAQLPSAISLSNAWKSFISAATLKEVKLEENFCISDLAGLVEEDGYPKALLEAIIARVSINGEDLMNDWAIIDQNKCTPWIGTILLQSQDNSKQGTQTSTFLQEWQNVLPEPWRKHVSLETLKGKYLKLADDRIAFNNETSTAERATSSALAKAPGKGARKWHEKFKNERRQ